MGLQDRNGLTALGIVQFDNIRNGHEFIRLATGTYVMDKSNSCLTASREMELRELRAAGNTGSQTLYQELAKLMPQNADIHYEFIHGKIIQ